MASLNRAAILTTLMTLASTMSVHEVQADPHKGKKTTAPGLEKHGFVPPGQAKKWARGMVIPPTMAIVPFHEWASLNLAPPPRGAFYGYVDRDLLLITNAGHEVLDAVVAVDAALNAVGR